MAYLLESRGGETETCGVCFGIWNLEHKLNSGGSNKNIYYSIYLSKLKRILLMKQGKNSWKPAGILGAKIFLIQHLKVARRERPVLTVR